MTSATDLYPPRRRLSRHGEWLQCDRCDFGYSGGYKSRGELCGDLSWIPLAYVRAENWSDEAFVDVFECKGRVWPASWMAQRPVAEIAEERARLILTAPLLIRLSRDAASGVRR